ncbi:hypothetical protein [Paenibacillus sp. QZ-Y1]|uniref:hypothetical protein n=1 Tax=Paenibacillus sp. QZ-Y1 TaxID=3414511 RepID=UPI003F78FB34
MTTIAEKFNFIDTKVTQIDVHCAGVNNRVSFVIESNSNIVHYEVRELNSVEKERTSEPAFLQILAVNMAMDHLLKSNINHFNLMISENGLKNYLSDSGKAPNKSTTSMNDLKERLSNFEKVQVNMIDTRLNLARIAIKEHNLKVNGAVFRGIVIR